MDFLFKKFNNEHSGLKYYNKCRSYYKISFCSAIFIIIDTQIGKAIKLTSILEGLIIVGAFLLFTIATSLGLISGVNSIRKREPLRKWRILYLAGHVFFFLIMIRIFIDAYIAICRTLL